MTKQYAVEVKGEVVITVYVDAESPEQARDIAREVRIYGGGLDEVHDFYSDLSGDGQSVVVASPIDLEWEIDDFSLTETSAEEVEEEVGAE